MSLLLKWAKRNSVDVITEIYRGDTPLDKANLPAPLVTLSNQETQYLDTTAVTGQTYYYMWVSYNMQHQSPAYSPSTAITVAQRRGVGPNTLITGNSDLGYFGDVTQAELIGNSGLLAAQNPGSSPLTSSGWDYVWRKCIYKGKILYIPRLAQFNDTWANVYRAGFMYGAQDRSKLPVAPSFDANWAIPQNRRVTINGDTYIIRLMKGYSDDPTRSPPTDIQSGTTSVTLGFDTTPAQRYDNEYDALFTANVTKAPYWKGLPNFPSAMVPGNGARYGTHTQELVTSANALGRGGLYDSNSNGAGRFGIGMYIQRAFGLTAGATAVILELVEG